jgi:hypothetical protein
MIRAIIGFLALLGAVTLAHAAGPAEDSIYGTPAEARWAPFHANYANVPACDDLRVLSNITGRFAGTENEYWGGQHAIAEICADQPMRRRAQAAKTWRPTPSTTWPNSSRAGAGAPGCRGRRLALFRSTGAAMIPEQAKRDEALRICRRWTAIADIPGWRREKYNEAQMIP